MQIKIFTNLFLGSGLATEKCSGVILSQPCVPFNPTVRDAYLCLITFPAIPTHLGSAGLVGPGPTVYMLHPFLVSTYRRIIWETCPKCGFRGPSHQSCELLEQAVWPKNLGQLGHWIHWEKIIAIGTGQRTELWCGSEQCIKLLLLLSRFSGVRLYDPIDGSPLVSL